MAAARSLNADQAAPQAAGDFLRVPLEAFRMQSAVNTDLYCLPPGATTPLLYRSALLPLSKGDLDVLSQRGPQTSRRLGARMAGHVRDTASESEGALSKSFA